MKKLQPGFTFIEVVISLAIVGVISGLSISMLLQGTEIFVGAKDDSHLMNESRTAIWRISREVHNLASNNFLELSKLLPEALCVRDTYDLGSTKLNF